jgi:hypothetical protein
LVTNFVIYTTDKHLAEVSHIELPIMAQIILPNTVETFPVGKRLVPVPHSPVGKLKIIANKIQ